MIFPPTQLLLHGSGITAQKRFLENRQSYHKSIWRVSQGGRGDFPDFLRVVQRKLNLRQSSSQRGTRRFKLVTCVRFPERIVELAEDVVAEALVVEGRRLARVITGPQIVGADGFVQLSGPIQVIAAGDPKAFVGAHAIAK